MRFYIDKNHEGSSITGESFFDYKEGDLYTE